MRAVVLVLVWLAVSPEARAQQAPRELSLPGLVREALEHNPEIQVAARTLEAKRARVGQAAALPDPMLMYGVINEGRPVPFQTLGERDFSEAYVGISQDLPFPGKRRLRKEAAQEEVEAAQSAYEGARRRGLSDGLRPSLPPRFPDHSTRCCGRPKSSLRRSRRRRAWSRRPSDGRISPSETASPTSASTSRTTTAAAWTPCTRSAGP